MSTLDLAVIGNCIFSALIDKQARILWSCMPRFDGDPVFCSLLGGTEAATSTDGWPPPVEGAFDIALDNFDRSEQRYLKNSAIVETILYDRNGAALRIVDFAPRFKQLGRLYRPITIVRRLEPLAGTPRIRIRLRPEGSYGAAKPEITRGSNHARYILPRQTLRLTTDIPISFIVDEIPMLLDRPANMVLGPDETLVRPLTDYAREMEERTTEYWVEWVRYLSLPPEWQEEIIRAAITLKLCSFEESGAIIAAMTTSIPEAAHTQRNWDYRFCWLRDSYFVVQALNRLGATKTMEDYLGYIANIAAGAQHGKLQPVYGIMLEERLIESEVSGLPGYRGMGPVRVGNQAYEHIQNDIYGSVVLASTQAFFDSRLIHPGDQAMFERLEHIGAVAAELHDQPDAGLWELRTSAHIHTYSSLMCWAACDRLAKIAVRLELAERAGHWRRTADRIHATIMERAWNKARGAIASTFGGAEMDASLLLIPALGFLPGNDPRFLGTLAAIEKDLRRGDTMFRYATPDDFGVPTTAFNVCTFWYIEALIAAGRRDEARDLFKVMLARRSSCGLLSEDMDVKTGEPWGNFPQTYSMVGLINTAMKLSQHWDDVL
ncbi:MAG TPA: glycoside hydrolase family 15 protein [Alphaproteobacteria bacterium]|jgi:GH15 family glucan-1,4-alpha-glucosidase